MCSFSMLFYILLSILHLAHAGPPKCPCGWVVSSGERYTHRIHNDFSRYSDLTESILTDPKAKPFTNEFLINGYDRPADNPTVRVDMAFSPNNVQIKDGNLVLTQKAYSVEDFRTRKAVSVAGIQSKTLDILHGTFRTTMKIEGANGSTVASFFWYHNDSSEVDIEYVSKGNSIVNNTINYTSHPSVHPDGQPIVNATRSVHLPKDDFLAVYREHRFDCTPEGVKYYLDGQLQHIDTHSIPQAAGSLQLNLWSDGNRYWSGFASTTDVSMKVRNLLVYFNTSTSGTDKMLFDQCIAAGGPEKALCREGEHLELDDEMVQTSINVARRMNSAFLDKGWSELGCLLACIVMLGLTAAFVLFG